MESVEVLDTLPWSDTTSRGEVCVEAERAAQAVSRLRPDQQQVLNLGILHGLTHSEIAARTGLPLGTVKTYMRRGLIQVREWMEIPAGDLAEGAQP
jgi:RNA polymerase sigma-70 factor (ECF subfamily)